MRSANARTGKSESGFTLVELLIVIVILGVLAAIVVFSVSGVSDRGDVAACQTEVTTVDTAEEASLAGGNGYVASIATLQADGYLRGTGGTLSYVASYDTTTNKVVLNGTAPAGCIAE